jgi:N-acetylglucosamine repressor
LKLTDRQRPAADLEKRLGIPAVLIQEAHALCLAEWHYGLAVGMENFAVLDFGVGVGVGVMMAGQLMLGQHGFAGEIGHITVVSKDGEACGCGNRGCLETVCNDAAFARRVSRQLHRSVSMDEALHLLETGRAPLGNVLRETAEFFSIACAAVINLFNPKSLFVQSQLLRRDPRLFDTIQQLIRTRALRPMLEECTIDLARGNKMQGAVAAIVRHLTNAVIGTE